MADHDGKVDLDALFEDGASLRDALLAGDMTEVRFLARRLAASADNLRLGEVLSAANTLVSALGADGTPPRTGYGKAVFDLSDAINEVLEGPRP